MKIVLVILATLALAGCKTTQNVVQTKLQVVVPDESLYNCPVVKNLPNSNNLTDVQVAKLIVQLYKNNKQCKNSEEAVKKYLDEAKKLIEESEAQP